MSPSDPDWPRCACGCGEPVPVRKASLPSKGLKRGEPCRFVAGHSSRLMRKPLRDGQKQCSACREWKPVAGFSKNATRASGYDPRCKACFSAYHREYQRKNRARRTEAARRLREANPDYQRQNVARWRERNRERHLAQARIYASARRARLRDQFVEHVDAFVVYERDRGICALCDLPVSRDGFHVDHDIPLSRGGEHSYANVQLAHPSCNSRKKDRL